MMKLLINQESRFLIRTFLVPRISIRFGEFQELVSRIKDFQNHHAILPVKIGDFQEILSRIKN